MMMEFNNYRLDRLVRLGTFFKKVLKKIKKIKKKLFFLWNLQNVPNLPNLPNLNKYLYIHIIINHNYIHK